MHIGASTAREIINAIFIAIWEVLSPIYFMTNPTPEKWRKITEQFERYMELSKCLRQPGR